MRRDIDELVLLPAGFLGFLKPTVLEALGPLQMGDVRDGTHDGSQRSVGRKPECALNSTQYSIDSPSRYTGSTVRGFLSCSSPDQGA